MANLLHISIHLRADNRGFVALKDYDGGFPAEFYFFDIEDEKLKKMTVTEVAWNHTLKTFKDNDNISRNVVIKYMSKHDTVQTTQV